jgi:N-acetylneuraminic acid mutarotase
VYLVGGYDGRIPRREIYRTSDGRHFELVGRLPVGLRYAAVAAVGTSLIVAGGIASSGATKVVYSFDPASRRSRLLGRLPAAIAHASAVTLGGIVYVIGGADATGSTVGDVTAIDVGKGTIRPVPAVARVSDAAAVLLGGRALIIGGAANGRAVATVRELR